MDHTIATLLFQSGRLQTILWLLLFSHVLLFWYWRQDLPRRQWSVLWPGICLYHRRFAWGDYGWRRASGGSNKSVMIIADDRGQ